MHSAPGHGRPRSPGAQPEPVPRWPLPRRRLRRRVLGSRQAGQGRRRDGLRPPARCACRFRGRRGPRGRQARSGARVPPATVRPRARRPRSQGGQDLRPGSDRASRCAAARRALSSRMYGLTGGGAMTVSPTPRPRTASSIAAVSRTVRLTHSSTPGPDSSPDGPALILPCVGFRPDAPQHAAGIRMEPEPSVACATGTMPDATAAAAPPLEPPSE
jgi:hypothetical protein